MEILYYSHHLFMFIQHFWSAMSFPKIQEIPKNSPKIPKILKPSNIAHGRQNFFGLVSLLFFELFKICLYKLLESPELNIMLFCQFASQSSSKQYFELKSVSLKQNESWIIWFFFTPIIDDNNLEVFLVCGVSIL